MTWNILADAYVLPKRYPLVKPEHLVPERRRALLLAQLIAQDADLYCLQEVEAAAAEAISQALGDGYAAIYEQKRGKPDGCGLWVRRSAFAVEAHEAIHYQAIDPGYDHVAVLGSLRHTSGRPVVVASTHLRWQPGETPNERHLGRLQMLELLERRRELGGPTWIVAGDFNAAFDGVVIQAALEHGLDLSARSQRPWDTVNIDGRKRKLDYLLITPDLVPSPRPLPRLERDTPMPSEVYPSDHLPLQVDYRWRE